MGESLFPSRCDTTARSSRLAPVGFDSRRKRVPAESTVRAFRASQA